MAVTSVLWNMLFNHYFEKFEAQHQLRRTFKIRVLHAIGFEGGLMLATIPMVAYALEISLLQAILIDLLMTLSILLYTFIFQYCYDHIRSEIRLCPATFGQIKR